MYFFDFSNAGGLSAEFQLALLEWALRVLTVAALTTVGMTSLAHVLLGLAASKRR